MVIKNRIFLSIIIISCCMLTSSCTKSDGPLLSITEDAEFSLSKNVKMLCRQANYNYEDLRKNIPSTVEMALGKASMRHDLNANYKVIPLYALVYCETKKDRLRFRFVGLGKLEDWRQTDEIWIMLQRNKGEMCEIFETSLDNIETGATTQWDDELKYGMYDYKCVNPFLGYETLSNEDIYKSIEAGDIQVYFMLANGRRYRGRRIGKITCKRDDWMKYLESEMKVGLLVELSKIASGNGKCLFRVP